jgi:hypothetical protein
MDKTKIHVVVEWMNEVAEQYGLITRFAYGPDSIWRRLRYDFLKALYDHTSAL